MPSRNEQPSEAVSDIDVSTQPGDNRLHPFPWVTETTCQLNVDALKAQISVLKVAEQSEHLVAPPGAKKRQEPVHRRRALGEGCDTEKPRFPRQGTETALSDKNLGGFCLCFISAAIAMDGLTEVNEGGTFGCTEQGSYAGIPCIRPVQGDGPLCEITMREHRQSIEGALPGPLALVLADPKVGGRHLGQGNAACSDQDDR